MPPHDASSRSSGTTGGSGTSPTEGHEEAGDSLAVTHPMNQEHREEDDLVAVEDAANEEWASNEGYTPLADLGGTGEMAMFMAFPPNGDLDENSDDGGGDEGGVFFADMSAFGPGPDTIDNTVEFSEEHEECTNDEQLEGTSSGQQQQYLQASSEPEENDFRTLADQALSALDQEYAQTLQMSLPKNEPAKPTPVDTATSSDSCTASAWKDDTTAEAPSSGEETTNALTPSIASSEPRELPNIDANAVRRAVQSIRLKAPDLTTNLDQRSFDSALRAPKQHQIIPSAPLAAFRKKTPKAVKATANLSRSATLAESVLRLMSLSWYLNDKDVNVANNADSDDNDDSTTLVIHVIGADPVECESPELTKILFGPFARWMNAWKRSNDSNTPPQPAHIRLYLNGPNLPNGVESQPPVDLMPPTTPNTNIDDGANASGLKSATAIYVSGLYHDWMSGEDGQYQHCKWEAPDFCIAFNAGVWGYSDWHPTIEAINKAEAGIPFVVTSYTVEEAEDDEDAIKELISDGDTCDRCIWKPVPNPFGSKQKRETATAVNGREYRENAAWQAWKLGAKGIKL